MHRSADVCRGDDQWLLKVELAGIKPEGFQMQALFHILWRVLSHREVD